MTAPSSRGFTPLGITSLGGRPDSLQIMASRGYAYVTHPFSGGFSVVDIRDPRSPLCVTHVPAPPGTLTLHLQLSGDILLVTNEADTSSLSYYREKQLYFGTQMGHDLTAGLEYSAGIRIYDVSTPAEPLEISMLEIPGAGVHRLWWAGEAQALASCMPAGSPDFQLAVLDMNDPVHPQVAHHWAPREDPSADGRLSLHHAILEGEVAYAAWRAGGLQIIDVGNREPVLLGSLAPAAWGGGNTHTTLPLPGRHLVALADESVLDGGVDGRRRIWLLDVSDPSAVAVVSSLPEPSEWNFRTAGGVFGPHNLHENRAGTWRSESTLFATYQNAGIRVYDISTADQPREIAYSVLPPPARTMDPRVDQVTVCQTADILVTEDGLVLASDLNGGLSLLEFTGES